MKGGDGVGEVAGNAKGELGFWSADSRVAASSVGRVTDAAGEAFIQVEDRIAVFDLDGTLMDELEYVYTKDDEVVLGGELMIIKTIKMNKACAIAQEIGKVPGLSFGNTAGDQSMAQYTINNGQYETRAYMLLCDDLVREHGNMKKADAMKRMCADCGFEPISTRDDFATIYGGEVEVVPYEKLEVETEGEVTEGLKPAA